MKTWKERGMNFRLTIPPDSKSPTNSIYGRYDIVFQGSVLNTCGVGARVVYSAESFKLRYLTKGKVVEKSAKRF